MLLGNERSENKSGRNLCVGKLQWGDIGNAGSSESQNSNPVGQDRVPSCYALSKTRLLEQQPLSP